MTTNVLTTNVLTTELIEKLVENNRYLNVVPNVSRKHNQMLKLSGTERMWKKDDKFVYVPKFRVAGPPETVRTFLRQHNFSNQDISDALRDAYGYPDGQPNIKGYKNELSLIEKIKETSKEKSNIRTKNEMNQWTTTTTISKFDKVSGEQMKYQGKDK